MSDSDTTRPADEQSNTVGSQAILTSVEAEEFARFVWEMATDPNVPRIQGERYPRSLNEARRRAYRSYGLPPPADAQVPWFEERWAHALEAGAHEGERDEFFRDLVFDLRLRGLSQAEATVIAREHWERADPGRRSFPWRHVEYKIERAWRMVQPSVQEWQQQWADSFGEVGKVGRTTVTRPKWMTEGWF